jgi:hypothetical protein
MKEKPIIFSAPMVMAILDGKKCMTRRIVKPQPERQDNGCWYWKNTAWNIAQISDLSPLDISLYQVGMRLWVRERIDNRPENGNFYYHADNKGVGEDVFKLLLDAGKSHKKSIPSVFMPRWASRITLEITDVKIERLQDITEEDAINEGVEYLFSKDDLKTVAGLRNYKQEEMGFKNYLWHGCAKGKVMQKWNHQYSSYSNAIGSFSSLWQYLNYKRGYGWDTNPWVWAISFKRANSETD